MDAVSTNPKETNTMPTTKSAQAPAQKITTFLWFNDNAEEATKFYCSIFPNSKILGTSHYGDAGPMPKGTVMTVDFLLNGQRFTALNGGPHFKFTEAISLVAHCEDQEEIDRYWKKLTEDGGQEVECGWLKDKYGLSWQIVPTGLMEMLHDPEKSNRVMKEVMQMKKLDVAKLKQAYNQK
jgi:predicted 3-demethylubiquinone-9 3-methyltransferase (glyoxalase superfamily)